MNTKSAPFRCFSLSLTLLLSLPPALSAQDAEEEEDVFELPEFVIDSSKDRGYTATNSLTGTFLDTPLKDSPFAIDVFTPDMIGDTGSTDMREILAYDSGLQLENTIAAQGDGQYNLGVEFDARGIENNETDIVTRGFRAPTLKNGFFTQTRVDTVNIGRVERAGGPQSLLYGIGAISGITNVITKRPLPEPRYSSELFVGNNDFYRATLEASSPLIQADDYTFGYIVSAATQTEGTAYPHEEEETWFVSPAFQLRAFDNKTSLYFNIEKGWSKEYGTGARDAAHPIAGIPDEDSGEPSGRRVTGDDATFLEDLLGMGHYVNLGGPDAYVEDDVLSATLEYTQQLGDHFRLLVSANRDEQFRDSREFTVGPSVLVNYDEGEYVGEDLRYAFGHYYRDRLTEQARVSLLASFEFLGGQHNFVVGRQELSETLEDVGFPESSTLLAQQEFQFWPADGSSIRYEGSPLTDPRWKTFYNEWYQGNYVIYQGSLWDGRINPVLGYRWDRSHTRAMRSNYLGDGEYGDRFDFLAERNSQNGYSNAGEPFEQETPTLGLSVALTDYLSVYGAYSEGIALANVQQRDGNEEGFPPEFTRSREGGFKFSFWEDRISGRVTYFELEKKGGVRYSFYAPAPYRENFNPDEPITAAMSTGSFDNPAELRKFMDFLGVYDLDTQEFERLPLDMPGVERVEEGGDIFFTFPFGDADNPGSYDPETNTAPNGYGQQLLAYIQRQRELIEGGNIAESPQYMWAGAGNHPGEDRGAYHNFDEESQGYEVRLSLRPLDNLQIVASYTYNTVEIVSGLVNLAQPEVITGMEPWFWYLPPENFGDIKDLSTYNGSLSSGVRNTDVPVHSFTLWSKYEFTDGWLEGFDLRFGARYTSERAAEAPWSSEGGFVDAIHRGAGANTKAPVPEFTLYDIGAGYRWEWKDIDWRVNLNIRNLFDETILTATSANTMVEGQPELTRFYLDGREIRVSLRAAF